MNRISFKYLIFLIFSLSYISCHDEKEVVYEDTPSRTILTYIIADNTLSYYANKNIDSIILGVEESNSNANILVYVDNDSDIPTLWNIIRNRNGKVEKKAIKQYPEQNSLDPQIMSGIIEDAFARFPSNEKGLILWSHGTGWRPSSQFKINSPLQKITTSTFSFGEDNNPVKTDLEIWELREILELTHLHFDFIFFDACHMASVEVAYELKDLTDYILASSTEIVGEGFPYASFIPVLSKNELNLPQLVDVYKSIYNGKTADEAGTISLIRTAGLEHLAAAYRTLYLLNKDEFSSLPKSAIQDFGRNCMGLSKLFYDLEDVVSNLPNGSKDDFYQALGSSVVKNDFTDFFGGSDYGCKILIEHCCGLTVYVPEFYYNERYNRAYNQLMWAIDTRQ